MVDSTVIDQIANDIKKHGDNFSALEGSTKRELEQMRAEIDSAGKKMDPLLDEKIGKFAASIEEKTNVLEKGIQALTETSDQLSAKLDRSSGGWSDEASAKSAKDAHDWHKALLANEGKLHYDTEVTADEGSYSEYIEAHSRYIRSRKDLTGDMSASLSTGSDPDGGYMVPTTRSSRIIERVYETSALRSLATVETIGGKELIIPRDEGEFGYGWVGEHTEPTETSTSQFGESKIAVHEMFAEPRVTQQMLEDAGFDIEGWLDRKVGSKFGRVEAAAFFNGTGTNQPRGLLTYDAGTTNGKIEQIASGNATTIAGYDCLQDLVFSLKDHYTANAQWMMKRTTVRDIAKIKDGDGQYIWQMGDVKAGTPSTLLNYTVNRGEDMPAIAANALPIVFGDFREAYTIVDRMGITLLKDNLTAKPYVKFYNRRRVGGDVVNFEAVKILKITA